MYCKNCGTEIHDGERFCPNCGSAVENGSRVPATEYPSNYLALGIITTILCCIPFGIISIIYSGKVDSAISKGSLEEAREMSRKARMWAIIGMCFALIFIGIYLIFILITLGIGSLDFLWDSGTEFFNAGMQMFA